MHLRSSIIVVSRPLCMSLYLSLQLLYPSLFNKQQTKQMRWAEHQKYWLSDPGVYPVLGCLGAAGCLCVGFIAYFITTSPDVQISPIKR